MGIRNIILCGSLTLLVLLLSLHSKAQRENITEKYWVFLTDKNGATFDPYTYFDAKAIERRIIHGLSLYDVSDYPVSDAYIDGVMQLADSLKFASRWFNALVVFARPELVPQIEALPYVSHIFQVQAQASLASVDFDATVGEADTTYPNLYKQLERMGAASYALNGITGKGIRVAVFDAGFPAVDTHEAFTHIREHNRIIKTWDFVKKREHVYGYSSHGTSVLSCIAGIKDGKMMGMATEAEFLLARTEMSVREPFSEEENWLAAAEWADQNGAHIINSSLGYTYHRYFPEVMDGRSTLVSRAANMAASKGILVVNAAGNDGDNNWKYVGAPADADSVLSVGGLSGNTKPCTSIEYPVNNYKIYFSSYGPTYDKRMKPNVCAYGEAYVASKRGYQTASGTSFSSPLVAGFAACALQTNPQLTNMELFRAIEQSADLWPYFDYAHGYGVPQARFFTEQPIPTRRPQTFLFQREGQMLKIIVSDFTWDNMGEEDGAYGKVLFYNIQNPDDTLDKYFVLSVDNKEIVSINFDLLMPGQRINASFLGYYSSFLKE